jgi:hypothetical protein
MIPKGFQRLGIGLYPFRILASKIVLNVMPVCIEHDLGNRSGPLAGISRGNNPIEFLAR